MSGDAIRADSEAVLFGEWSVLIIPEKGVTMIFHNSMVIPSLYTSEEQAVIERWLHSGPVYPGRDNLDDSNKVAEIALSCVQKQLPRSVQIMKDGGATLNRRSWESSIPMRNQVLFPIHLFEVDRNDAHPETICPESYFATLLAGYNVYVVTMSQASDASYGYFDTAVDFFEAVDNADYIASNARLILKACWRFQQKELNKPRWSKLLKSGLIEADSALRLRDEVWNTVENNAVAV